MKKITLLAFPLSIMLAAAATAQVATRSPERVPDARPVEVQRITIHGRSLEGNLEGNEIDRPALVFLPPGYASSPNRRYPVVYGLHGYSIGAEQWSGEIQLPQTAEGAFALGAHEMIIVLPDSKTLHNGSMYSNSVTTGRFEDYVSRDVVAYIDANYRTLPARESRGLVGHSMGGYGATRIGMKHADVFGALYIMSPCCLPPRGAGAPGGANYDAIAAATTREAIQALPFGLRAQLAVASAWSPNPANPPLYLDLPVGDKAAEVLGKWAANAPLAFVDQYTGELERYAAISIDVGDQDSLVTDTTTLHEVLDAYGIEHGFEVYPGNHTSDVAIRFQDHVLPFFSKHLAFE